MKRDFCFCFCFFNLFSLEEYPEMKTLGEPRSECHTMPCREVLYSTLREKENNTDRTEFGRPSFENYPAHLIDLDASRCCGWSTCMYACMQHRVDYHNTSHIIDGEEEEK